MGKVQIEFSEQEMRDLAELCAMGLTILGQAMPDARNPRADAWTRLMIHLLKAARNVPSLSRDMELSPDCGYWFFKHPYVDGAFYSDVLDEYRDAVFWEELVTRMAMRTLTESVGEEQAGLMPEEDRAAAVSSMEKALWAEVSRHGIDRLLFMLSNEES